MHIIGADGGSDTVTLLVCETTRPGITLVPAFTVLANWIAGRHV